MTSFERELKTAMRDVANADARPGFAEETSVLVARKRPAARRSYLLTAAAGIAAATALVAGVQALDGGAPASRPSPGSPPPDSAFPDYNGVGVVGPGEPCPNAVRSPIPDLASAARQQIWLPDERLASVTDAWSCGTGGAPVLMFDDVQVSYEAGWADVDLTKKWADYIAEDGGYTITVDGRSALVHEATDAAPNNEILVVNGDTLIRFLSVREVPIGDLLALVRSFAWAAPAVRP